MFSKHTEWLKVDEEETHDYFFTDERGDLRSTMNFDQPVTVSKKKINTVTLSQSQNQYDVRACLSSEEKIISLPAIVRPTCVRIKQRTSFFADKNWRYDLTRVWMADSRQKVEKLHKFDDPSSFEIEVELINPREILRTKNKTNDFVAFSLLLKILSLLKNPTKLEYEVM